MVVGLLAGTAFAGRGSGHGGSTTTGGGTITLADPLVVDQNDNGKPNFGDVVTFNVSTTATTQQYSTGVLRQRRLLQQLEGLLRRSLDSNWNFVLGSGGWTSGAADCTAWLGMYTKRGFNGLIPRFFHVDP